MSRPLTVAMCCNSAFGVANFRGGVIRALVAAGHRVVVVAPDDPVHVGRLRALGAEFVPWAVSGRGTYLLRECGAVVSLWRIYRRLRPDLAFHFTVKAVLYGALAARASGTRFVSIITGLGYLFLNESWVSRAARHLYRRTLAWSREVWFLNEDDRQTFERLGLVEPGARLLPGEGVDTAHFAPRPRAARREGVTFLMLARLLRDKGVIEFVEAARIVRAANTEVHFQLMGPADSDNPSAISLRQAEQWQAEGLVEYLGTALDVRPAIAGADCVVLPSYREGAPRTLLEAAAMGKAVLTTNVPGCRDVVTEGNGLLCEARDAVSLASQIQALARRSRGDLDAMGERGRKLVIERFDERIVIGIYLESLARLA